MKPLTIGERIEEFRAKALPVVQSACPRLGEDECATILDALAHHGYVAAGPSVDRAREALADVLRERNLTPDGWKDIWALLDSARSERDALRTKLAEVEEQLGVVTLNDDMASGIFAELHEVLNAQPCPCGSKDHTSTPPMMYREWLLSVLAGWDLALAASQARERELREAGETALKAMQAIAEREGDALLLGTSFDDACAVQDKLSAALARPTDDSALRGLCERVGEVFRARLLAIAQERSEVASRGDEGAAYEADWLRAVAERIQSASIVNQREHRHEQRAVSLTAHGAGSARPAPRRMHMEAPMNEAKDDGLVAVASDLPEGYYRVSGGIAMRLNLPEDIRQEAFSEAATNIEFAADSTFPNEDACRAAWLAAAGSVRATAAHSRKRSIVEAAR